MSLIIMFYFTSSMLNMCWTLIYPSSGACTFSIESPHWLCVLVSMCVWVSVWLQPATRIPPQPSHTKTPTLIETRTYVQCCDSIEKSQARDDGCINVRNMLSIEAVKWNIIISDIKWVPYSSTGTNPWKRRWCSVIDVLLHSNYEFCDTLTCNLHCIL